MLFAVVCSSFRSPVLKKVFMLGFIGLYIWGFLGRLFGFMGLYIRICTVTGLISWFRIMGFVRAYVEVIMLRLLGVHSGG